MRASIGPVPARVPVRVVVGRAVRPLVLLLLFASGVVGAAQPSVVVSLHPYYDLARTIAGAHADVVRILPPGASPHTFDPTPRDVGRIAGSDLVIMNGGVDLWLRDLVEASGTRAPILEITGDAGVQEAMRSAFPDLVATDAGGTLIGFNPHVWLDPIVMVAATEAIAGALSDVDPANEASYRAAALELAAELVALHAELSATLAPVRGAAFVPFHDAWPYFAARYGLDLVVEIEPFPGREPSPAYLRGAIEAIRAAGASAIFSEIQLNRRPADVVAAEAGVALHELDPLGGAAGRDRYADLMRHNAAIIVEALE